MLRWWTTFAIVAVFCFFFEYMEKKKFCGCGLCGLGGVDALIKC